MSEGRVDENTGQGTGGGHVRGRGRWTGIKTLALARAARSRSLSLACLGGRLETLGETLVTTHLSLRGGSLSRARALSFSLSDASF